VIDAPRIGQLGERADEALLGALRGRGVGRDGGEEGGHGQDGIIGVGRCTASRPTAIRFLGRRVESGAYAIQGCSSPKRGRLSVSCPGLPGCWSQGTTEKEALENIQDAIREYLAAMSAVWDAAMTSRLRIQ
jgi:HicB_like antitoxin of bacterial toxin-antitoxin system